MSHELAGVGMLNAGGIGTYDVWYGASGVTGGASAQPIPPSTGISLNCQSDDLNDASGGSGANTVALIYIDTSGDAQEYRFSMSGTTAVDMPADLWLPQCLHVVEHGTDYGYNAGNITLTDAGGDVYKYMPAGENRCLSTVRMVPRGYYARITGWNISSTGTGRTRGFLQTTSLDSERYDGVFVTQSVLQTQDGPAPEVLTTPIIVPELTIIKTRVTTEKAAFVTSEWRADMFRRW